MGDEEVLQCCDVIAEALRDQGVQYVFGIVGIPVIELGVAFQSAGVHFIGTRNEQSASYAASAVGYLTGRPAGCLVVPGPGLIHALAGMANSAVNCWPLIVIAGGYDQDQGGMGGFQECNQVESCRPYVKYAVRLERMESIPFHIEKAVRHSLYGRPGVSYIEVPGNMITSGILSKKITFLPRCPDSPLTYADPCAIVKATQALKSSKRPLIIVGKGAAYARAEAEVSTLVTSYNLPFLPTPMGKGLLPDDHLQCVAAARSRALKDADVIVLLGARLNWILHFGMPPRFSKNVKMIQVDICPEEMGNNASESIMLVGDIKAVVTQLNSYLTKDTVPLCKYDGLWWKSLKEKKAQNLQINQDLASNIELPMSFYCAYNVINKYLPRDCIIVNEGSTTMDIGRTVLLSHHPRQRLDAGTFGTMGVGCGFAIAAALVEQLKPIGNRTRVVSIQGDSAFGFSGMEFETACRYKLPIVFIVMNNNGIYNGLDGEAWESVTQGDENLGLSIPPTALHYATRYDRIALAFDAKGYNAQTIPELDEALHSAFHIKRQSPVIINVVLSPTSARKAQEHSWLTRSNL